MLRRLRTDERAQDLIEYALLAAFISLAAVSAASLVGTALNVWYSNQTAVVVGFPTG